MLLRSIPYTVGPDELGPRFPEYEISFERCGRKDFEGELLRLSPRRLCLRVVRIFAYDPLHNHSNTTAVNRNYYISTILL